MIPVPDSELRRLTDRLLDEGRLSAPEIDRLAEIVKAPDALDWFLSVVQQEALLREVIPEYVAATSAASRTVSFPGGRRLAIASGFAAALVLGMGLGALWLRPPVATTPVASLRHPGASGDARVTALIGVRWAAATQQTDLLDGGLAPGRLALDAGLAEVTYANGVRVTIEGPCEYSIVDKNSGRLDFGKLVAHVPRGAEGFRVDYSRGRIVDLGTEFAMDLSRDGTGEIGVFEGKIEVHHGDRKMLPLFANQAVQASAGSADDSLLAIPFDREKFIRQVPARDFRWEVRTGEPVKFSADVSHLVWKASDYRILFKCFQGSGALGVRNVRLLLDGKEVVADPGEGRITTFRGSLQELRVSETAFARGRWTVEAELATWNGQTPPAPLVGIMQFEEGLVKQAVAKDFVGRWNYSYYGHRYVRIFSEDGVVTLLRDGVQDPGYKPGPWTVEDGVLTSREGNGRSDETCFLRDKDTLVFTNRPYENAKRAPASEKK